MLLLPIDFEVAGKTLSWYRGDSEEKYLQNKKAGNEPPYGPGEFTYQFNSLGYRGPEIRKKSQCFRICFYGCSLMEGYGLPEDKTIAAQFADGWMHGPLEFYNFGKASASNDFISNLILSTVPVIQPDLVVVYWTYLSRRELYAPDGEILKWNSSWDKLSVPIPDKYHGLCEAQTALENNHSNVANFSKNYQLVKHYLATKDISMLWGLANSAWLSQLGHHLDYRDMARYASVDLKDHQSDYGRDMEHPGPETAGRIANQFLIAYINSQH